MKNISTGLVLALTACGPAGLWLSYSFAPSAVASVQAEGARSVVAASYTHTARPPAVQFQWIAEPKYSWCNCPGGCVPPGGTCIPRQEYLTDSSGSFEMLGNCTSAPSAIGRIEVRGNSVWFVGAAYDGLCTADCCANCQDFECFVGGLIFVQDQRLLFDRPVLTAWDNREALDPWASVPRADHSLHSWNGDVFRQFPFTTQRSDFDANGTVDGADLGLLLYAWMRCIEGNCGVWARFDLNDDRQIDGADLGEFLVAWGPVT
jgi:hypothetical protein